MNLCGPQVKKYRGLLNLSQQELAEKCQLLGWDVSRDIIARIELRVRCVEDGEMLYLCRSLKTSPSVLLGFENECVRLCPFRLLKNVRLARR